MNRQRSEAFYAIKEEKIGGEEQWENQQDLWNMTDRISRLSDPKERIKHFKEFHTPLSKEEQESCREPDVWRAAYRSASPVMMLMGMASGCPLHNLVPEWNDLILSRELGRGILQTEKDE